MAPLASVRHARHTPAATARERTGGLTDPGYVRATRFPARPFPRATCYTDSMSTELVASAGVIDAIRERGGALYVWPRKARCCGGTITLEAATGPPDKLFRRVEAADIDVFVPVGMAEPETLHVEISRRGRIRAFWNGLAWVD